MQSVCVVTLIWVWYIFLYFHVYHANTNENVLGEEDFTMDVISCLCIGNVAIFQRNISTIDMHTLVMIIIDLSLLGDRSWAFTIWDGNYTNINVLAIFSSTSLLLTLPVITSIACQERKANILQHSIYELRGIKVKVRSGSIRSSVQRGIGKWRKCVL